MNMPWFWLSNRGSIVCVTILVFLSFRHVVRGQNTSQAPSRDELTHTLSHLKGLEVQAMEVAPTTESRKRLESTVQKILRKNLRPVANNPALPKETRDLAKVLATQKSLSDLWRAAADPAHPGWVNPAIMTGIKPFVETQEEIQQRLDLYAPALAAQPGTGAIRYFACNGDVLAPGELNPFASLISWLSQNPVRAENIYRAVGRIEVKFGNETPRPAGTAFVLDRMRGRVVTACHVVNEVWNRSQNGMTGTVLLDFGPTAIHDPQNEYRVKNVAFLPTIDGCDGALLDVDTSDRPLPGELIPAEASPTLTNGTFNVLSVGYPLSYGTDELPETRRYFDCVWSQGGKNSKFIFGGEFTGIEPAPAGGYSLIRHSVPTIEGQSGSPIIDFTNPNAPKVIGIHICCMITQSFNDVTGIQCQRRVERLSQAAVSLPDLLKLYKEQQARVPPQLIPRGPEYARRNHDP